MYKNIHLTELRICLYIAGDLWTSLDLQGLRMFVSKDCTASRPTNTANFFKRDKTQNIILNAIVVFPFLHKI